MKTYAICAALLLCAAPALAQTGGQQNYEDLPTSAGVGKWEPHKQAQSYKITVDGDAIFVNGVEQKVKYDPAQDIAIVKGEAVLVPRGQGLTLKARTVETVQPAQPLK